MQQRASSSATRHPKTRPGVFTAQSVLLVFVLAAQLLFAADWVHSLFHSDAGQPGHQCAATGIAKGSLVSAPPEESPVRDDTPQFLPFSPKQVASPAARPLLPPGRAPPSA